MSYEFNPDSQTLELPNPYKVENLSLLVSAAVSILCGLIAVILVKDRLVHDFSPTVGLATVIGITLLALGISLGVRALRQLRFFFGRNRPESLAPTLAPGVDGDSPEADLYKESLRHNALTFTEPKGPVNGLLYSWLPQLIFSPAVIQRAAQRQFQTFLGLAVILTSFLLCWLLVGGTPASSWIGIIYAVLAYYYIAPLRQTMQTNFPSDNVHEMGSGGLIFMAVMSIVGPVVFATISSKLPDMGGLSVNSVFTFAMLLAMATVALFIMALRKQLGSAPQEVGTARVLETVTMNAHPNKLLEELDRILMNDWFSQIPNRRYTQKLPRVHGHQGQFAGEILDETQPQPKPNGTATDLRHALKEPYFQWLTYLTATAMSCMVAGAIVSLLVVNWLLKSETYGPSLALALSFISIGIFAQQSAHIVWGRFDFVSRLIWVEFVGSYESANVNIGNQITGNVQTAKSVINIEGMTMRVWVSEIESIIFGKDARRQLIRMRGLQPMAEQIAKGLKEFGESRSMILAPSTVNDAARAQKVGEINHLVGNSNTVATSLPQQVSNLLGKGSVLTCSKCNTSIDANAKFCGQCGSTAESAVVST